MVPIYKLKSNLSLRFSIFVLIVTSVLGLTFSVAAGLKERESDKAEIEHIINQIKLSHIPFLINSLWVTNQDLLQHQIEAIVRFPYIMRVEVSDDEGNIYYAGEPIHPDAVADIHELHYTYKNKEQHIGTLVIYIDEQELNSRLFQRLVFSILFHLVLSLISAVVVIIISYYLIIRHLDTLRIQLKNDHMGNLKVPLRINRKKNINDELSSLLTSVNNLRANLNIQLDNQRMMIREVHHRIKNNLQTLDSMIALQMTKTDNDETDSALREIKNRLKSVTILYEKLYKPEIPVGISAGEYLHPLIEEIISSFPAEIKISTTVDILDRTLDQKVLFPLGIILNELITNTVKYAFNEKDSGLIEISLKQNLKNEFVLVYKDNGTGMSDSIDTSNKSGLGFLLIEALVQQLNGTYEIQNNHCFYIQIIWNG